MARGHGVDVGLVVRFSPEKLTTQQFARLFQHFDYLSADLLQLELYRQGRHIPPRPRVPRASVSALRMNSPIEISVEGSGLLAIGLGGGLTLLHYALRHPRQIGAWVPSVVKGWRDGWSEVARGERDAALEQANRPALTTGTSADREAVASDAGVVLARPLEPRSHDDRSGRNVGRLNYAEHEDPLIDLVRRTASDARRLEQLGGQAAVDAIDVPEDLPQE